MTHRNHRPALGLLRVTFAVALPLPAVVTLNAREGASVGLTAPAPSISKVTKAADAVDEQWWAGVQRALARDEYHPRANDSGLQAPNRAHNLRTYFDPSGIRVHDRTAPGSPELVDLSLVALGRGASLEAVGRGLVQQVGTRVEIRRPGITEWFENSAQGLEQGFTLDARIKGSGPLVVELAVEHARAYLREDVIELVTDAGRRLQYAKLLAEDSQGRVLASRFDVPSPDRVRLIVEDADAVYPLLIDPALTGVPDARLESNQSDPQGLGTPEFGASVSGAGDVNGDGFADVIVGAPGWDGGEASEGAAFVFLGSAAGIVGADPFTAHARIESNQSTAELGTVSGAGDVNGDGFDDVIVGAHNYTDTLPGTGLKVDGAAFVFLGSAAGIRGTNPATAHAHIAANKLESELGAIVSGAGDVNGDGFDDIIVAAPEQGHDFPADTNIPPNQKSGQAGAALVFHGSAAGITGTGFLDADAVLLPYEPSDLEDPVELASFGGVAGAGDVNGDGYDDVLVGGSDVFLFLGSQAGIVGRDPTTAQSRIQSDQPELSWNLEVDPAGDVNGDGFDDVLLGAPLREFVRHTRDQKGAAYVFLGGPAGIVGSTLAQAHAAFFGSILAEWVGGSVAAAGDVDRDGFDDVLVAAREYFGSLFNEGVAYLFRGSLSGITARTLVDADARLEARQSGGRRSGPPRLQRVRRRRYQRRWFRGRDHGEGVLRRRAAGRGRRVHLLRRPARRKPESAAGRCRRRKSSCL